MVATKALLCLQKRLLWSCRGPHVAPKKNSVAPLGGSVGPARWTTTPTASSRCGLGLLGSRPLLCRTQLLPFCPGLGPMGHLSWHHVNSPTCTSQSHHVTHRKRPTPRQLATDTCKSGPVLSQEKHADRPPWEGKGPSPQVTWREAGAGLPPGSQSHRPASCDEPPESPVGSTWTLGPGPPLGSQSTLTNSSRTGSRSDS